MVFATAVSAAATPGAGEFLGVDWSSIALVSVTALVATVVIVSFFSLGLRLLAVGSPDDVDGGGAATVTSSRPVGATIGAVLCIGVGVVAVLYGIYLVIPLFH
jgi:uncharacterized membrane protein